MKCHFIYPDINTGYVPNVHHGLAQIISVLKANGQEASLHHVTKEPKPQEILKVIEREKPDYIGFTVMENQLEYVKTWIKWIKEAKLGIPIVVGGVYATLNQEELFNYADYMCIGEGEYPLLELLQGKKTKFEIDNLWFNWFPYPMPKLRPLINNLDELPFPDYSLFDMEHILKKTNGTFAVIASRGCPMSCSYCANHALRETYKGLGTYFRFRSVENTWKMLKYYWDKYSIKHFTFADDIFGVNTEWVKEFCIAYKSVINNGATFDCNLRVEMVNEDLLKALKSAGCTKVEMGIESGSEFIRYNSLNRKMTNEQIIKAFELCKKYGIKTRSYNMVGLPADNVQTIRETINLNKKVQPDEVAVFYFYPFKGTKLYDVCKEQGLLTEQTSTSYVNKSILKLPYITPKELKELYNEFNRFSIKQRLSKSWRWILPIIRCLTLGNDVNVIRGVYQWLKS